MVSLVPDPEAVSDRRRQTYGVKLVRGPFVELPPHPAHLEHSSDLAGLCRDLRSATPELRLAADLFSGAGGLSLGLQQAGIEVVLAVDHDEEAVRDPRGTTSRV